MSKSLALLTPRRRGRTTELSRRVWRTQLLPLGEINYKGRTIKFDMDYLRNVARSFKERAFGQVPFQLATDDNKHTNDPERFRGKIIDVVLTNDGLDVLVEPTKAGAELLRENPDLGVSARIYEEYERADGKHWTAALQHVLGTLDPRVPGMRTWREVEVPVALSSEIGEVEVVDLSDAEFEEGGTDKVAFSKEDRAALIELLKKAKGASDDELEGLVDELVEDDEDDDESDLTDDELEQLIAQAEAEAGDPENEDDEVDEDDEEEEPVSGRVPVAASNRGRKAVELANLQLAAQSDQIAQMQAVMDGQAFDAEKRQFAVLGIPPQITELARPLLEGSGHVVELSGGDEIDAGAVMRNVLRQLGQQIKVLDLSGVIGSGLEDDEEKEEAEQHRTETADFVKTARSQFGL
jgi:hypothetical protein